MTKCKDILTTAELLAEFGDYFSSASQIARLAKAGKLPHWRISPRNLRFSRRAVQDFLDSRYVAGAGDKLSGKLAGKLVFA